MNFDLKTEEAAFMAAVSAALIIAFVLFGISGAKTIVAFIIFTFPFYVILNNFKLETDEKLFFAFFLGLAFYAITVWTINRAIPSLKLSIIAAFILLTLAGLFWKKLKLPKQE